MPRGANNYDLLRLLLALAVIFGHDGALNPGHAYKDPVAWLTGFDYSGGVAVKAFFFLSGLFVTDSIVSRPSAPRCAVLRAAWIFPGLCACLLLCACAVGPLSRPVPPDAELRIGTTFLTSSVSGDLITALVPDAVFAKPGRLTLRVVEHVRGRPFTSSAVPWTVQ